MVITPKVQGHLIMLLVMTIFGLNIPLNKYLYDSEILTPFAMTALRMSFAAVAFWIASLFLPKEKISRKDIFILLIGGLSGMAINQGCFAYGLSQTSSVDASIITTSSPLFAMIIAAIVLKEPITLKKTGGVILGGLGAVILVYTSHIKATHAGSLKGDLAILTAQLFYSFYLVITRPLSTRYSPITMMKWMFTFSAVAVLPFFGKDLIEAPLFHKIKAETLLEITFVLIGATFITYMLIPLAQRRIRPTTISMYNNMQPLIASFIAILILGDQFTFEKLVAAIFIFAGVYLVTTSKSRKDVVLDEEVKQQ